MVICLRMGKIYMAKTPSGDFKVTTLENPLLSKEAVTSKGISIPYTNLQLNSYPNTQLDLFCNDNLSFSMHGSQYMTNQLRGSQYATSITNQKVVGCKVFQFIQTVKIMKLLGHKTLQCSNTTASSRTRANQDSDYTFLHSCGIFSCATCVTFNGP